MIFGWASTRRHWVRIGGINQRRQEDVVPPDLDLGRGALNFGEVLRWQLHVRRAEVFLRRRIGCNGDDGLESMMDRVPSIGKRLGIYELAQFTPSI